MKSNVSVELDVNTNDDKVDIDADNTKITTTEIKNGDKSDSIAGMIASNPCVATSTRLENKRIPQDIDFMNIHGVRTEARQKLTKVRPANFGQASRISGVSPADIAALMVYLEKGERNE